MSYQWLHIQEEQESPNDASLSNNEEDDAQENEEAKLFYFRSAYHRIIQSIDADIGVGVTGHKHRNDHDKDGDGYGGAEKGIKERWCKIIEETCVVIADDKVYSPAFLREVKNIAYLCNKNLSRLLAQLEDFPEAYQVAMNASILMLDLDNFDSGLMFHTASMALKCNDIWTCEQILSLNRHQFCSLYDAGLERLFAMKKKTINSESRDASLLMSSSSPSSSSLPISEALDSSRNVLIRGSNSSPYGRDALDILFNLIQNMEKAPLSAQSSVFIVEHDDAKYVKEQCRQIMENYSDGDETKMNILQNTESVTSADLQSLEQTEHQSVVVVQKNNNDKCPSSIIVESQQQRRQQQRGQVKEVVETNDNVPIVDSTQKMREVVVVEDQDDQEMGAKNDGSESNNTNRRSNRKREFTRSREYELMVPASSVFTKSQNDVDSTVQFWSEIHAAKSTWNQELSFTDKNSWINGTFTVMNQVSSSSSSSSSSGGVKFSDHKGGPISVISTIDNRMRGDWVAHNNEVLYCITESLDDPRTITLHNLVIKSFSLFISRVNLLQAFGFFSSPKFALVCNAVVNSWSILIGMNNTSIEDSLVDLDPDEILLIAECCANYIRKHDNEVTSKSSNDTSTGSINEALASFAERSLHEIMLHWYRNSCLEPVLSNDRKDVVRTFRRSWLILRHWVMRFISNDSSSAGPFVDVCSINSIIDFLDENVDKVHLIGLPHLIEWSNIDKENIRLMKTLIHENKEADTLINEYIADNEWLARATACLSKSTDLVDVFLVGATKGISYERILPLLIFKACFALDNASVWLQQATIFFEYFSGQLFALFDDKKKTGVGETQTWITGVLHFIFEHIPWSLKLGYGTWQEVRNDNENMLLLSLSQLLIKSQSRKWFDFMLILSDIAVNMITATSNKDSLRIFVEAFLYCIVHSMSNNNGTESHEFDTECISKILLKLLTVNAFIDCFSNDELPAICNDIINYYENLGNRSPILAFACTSLITILIMNLNSINVNLRLDIFLSYHLVACENNYYKFGESAFLLFLSNKLYRSFYKVLPAPMKPNESELSSVNDAGDLFNFEGLEFDKMQDFAACIGEIYWLLYSFPLISFSYEDGEVQCTLFSEPIETPELVKDLYEFHQICVKLEVSVKVDQKMSLVKLLGTDVLQSVACNSSMYRILDDFIFCGIEMKPIMLIDTIKCQIQNTSVEEVEGPLMKVLNSIYYETLLYLSNSQDHSRDRELKELNIFGNISSKLVAERPILQVIELCIADLCFNPSRYDTWALLHNNLIEMAYIFCDKLGEICVSSLLDDYFHMSILPSVTSFEYLSQGKFLNGNEVDLSDINLSVAFHRHNSRGLVGVNTLEKIRKDAKKSWAAVETDSSLWILLRTLATKNLLIRSIRQVMSLLRCHDTPFLYNKGGSEKDQSIKDVRDLGMLIRISHAKALQLFASEYKDDSTFRRSHLRESLILYEEVLEVNKESKAIDSSSLVFVTGMCAKLRWYLFHEFPQVLENIGKVVTLISTTNSALLKSASRCHAINDAAYVLFDMLCYIMVNPHGPAVNHINNLRKVSVMLLPKDNGNDTLEQMLPITGTEENMKVTSSMWIVFFNCVENLRTCKRMDVHNFRSVYHISSIIERFSTLLENIAIPAAVTNKLNSMGIKSLSWQSAYDEISTLFAKKYPQLVAIWYSEKLNNEWDSLLQRSYKFEHLRRKYTVEYLKLSRVLGGTLQPCLDLLKDALASKKQTATVRYMVDHCVKTVCSILVHQTCSEVVVLSAHKLSLMYDIYQVVHKKVSVNTFLVLQKTLVELYIAEGGHALPESVVEVFIYCRQKYEKWSGSTITFNTKYRNGGKKAKPKKRKANTEESITSSDPARKVIKDDVNSSSTNAEMSQEIEVKDNSEIVAL
jgi:hypothetical protein